MKKRLFSIFVALALTLGLLPTAALAAENVSKSTPVFEISGTNDPQVDGQYSSVLEGAKTYYEYAYGETCSMTLLADTSINISSENSPTGEGIPVGIIIAGAGSVLDLNGHTLTVTGSGCQIDNYSLPGMVISTSATSSAITVKSGKIVLNSTNLAGIMNGGNGLIVKDIEIVSGNNASNVIGIWNGLGGAGQLANTVIENCQVVLGQGNTDLKGTAYSESSYKIWVQSGSFTSNPVSEGQTSIAYAEGSAVLQSSLDGVTGAVITSPSTTAIIVKGGTAYTYNTLQDAVNAANSGAEILLVKQPEDGKVVVPDNAQLTLQPLEKGSGIILNEIPLETQSGTKLEISENGTLKPADISVTGVTLNKSALSLTVGDTEPLTATVVPENATNKTVTWSSSNTNVATVDGNGLVTAVAPGTASITATAGGVSAVCQVEVLARPLPGPGPVVPTFTVTVDQGIRNGAVTVSPRSASAGTVITITATPDAGYVLDGLTAVDARGNLLPLTDRGSGSFTFPMPASSVTVSASFAPSNAGPEAPAFADVPANAYYADAVAWAVKEGITSGTSATTFSPNASCTRAQMVTFLWRANGSPVVNYAMHFEDVPGTAWYAEAVRWAVSQGITTGTSDATFSPDAAVTRAQAVTFLYRAAGAPAVTGGGFTDVPDSAFYADAVAWALIRGITNGTSGATFSPSDICTRAQIVTFLYRSAAR